MSSQGAQDHPHQPLVGTHIGWALGKRFARVQFVRDFLCQPFVGIQLGFFLQLNWPRLRVNIVSPQTSENVFFFFTLMPSDYQVEHLDTNCLAREAIYGEGEALAGL